MEGRNEYSDDYYECQSDSGNEDGQIRVFLVERSEEFPVSAQAVLLQPG